MNCHRLNSPLNPRPMLPPLYHHEKTCEKMLKTKVPLDVEFNKDPASRQKSCPRILLKEGMAWKFLAGLTPFHQVEHHDMLRALSPDWRDQWEEAAKKGCQQHIIKAHSYSLKYRSQQWSIGKLCKVRYIYKEKEYSYWALVCITILHCLTKNSRYSVGRILRAGTEDEEVTRPWDRSDCTYIHIRIPNRSCKCQAPISSGRKDSKELENLDLFLQFPYWGTTDQWTSILNVHVHNGYRGVLVVRLRWI